LVPQTCAHVDDVVRAAFEQLAGKNLIHPGDEIIVVAGEPLGTSGYINLIEMRTVPAYAPVS
ncbi:MAG TPA: pyruvate kinase alpha/beta domain-containing protein, partial [Patescibacteria group bacterium]|nr:pyruvate kinase alpha/beta domain-containing protein [Patescibacteria group bacterium]